MTLDEAIQAVSEGGQALGVTCEDVYKHMAKDENFLMRLFTAIHAVEYPFNFEKFFEESATHLLNEALRAKLEDEFGALE